MPRISEINRKIKLHVFSGEGDAFVGKGKSRNIKSIPIKFKVFSTLPAPTRDIAKLTRIKQLILSQRQSAIFALDDENEKLINDAVFELDNRKLLNVRISKLYPAETAEFKITIEIEKMLRDNNFAQDFIKIHSIKKEEH